MNIVYVDKLLNIFVLRKIDKNNTYKQHEQIGYCIVLSTFLAFASIKLLFLI